MTDTASKTKGLTLGEAIDRLMNTSPVDLEQTTIHTAKFWRQQIGNYRRGKMTIDRQITLLKLAGFEVSQEMRFKTPAQ